RPERRPARGRDVHLLLRGALRGLAADGAGRGGVGRHHRWPRHPHDVAGLEVHAPRVPRAARVRHHRQRLAPAVPGAGARRALDDARGGVCRRGAGRRHRRVDPHPRDLAGTRSVHPRRAAAALPAAGLHHGRLRVPRGRGDRASPQVVPTPSRKDVVVRKPLVKLLAPALALGLAVSASACGGKREPTAGGGGECEAGKGSITIATGNSTGVYYVLGGGLAQVISKNSDLKATAAETGASVQNIEQLVSGDYDIAFSLE